MRRAGVNNSLRTISLFSRSRLVSRKMESQPFAVQQYSPPQPDRLFPYSQADLTPMDAGGDSIFYQTPRFVTHIDDNAINHLRRYYESALPKSGRILDFCSSWVSHYPSSVEQAATEEKLEIFGTGMNQLELSKNKVLKAWSVQDLNDDPDIKLPQSSPVGELDASTCVVSIDYLTKPIEVLKSVRGLTKQNGMVHLTISNRCFPTKAVSRWLKINEAERLHMVGDYLWWSGWRDIEIVTVVEGSYLNDPLWVVRGKNL